MNRPRIGWILIMGLSFARGADAALINRGGGLVYDTELNVTWLADANYAKTSGYSDTLYGPGSDGRMTWGQAVAWVSQLVYHDSVRNRDLRGWRLPVTQQPDPTCSMQLNGDSLGYNCTGSELGHLFYKQLGGKAATPIRTTHNANLGFFANPPDSLYWSGTSYKQDSSQAWGFLFDSGSALLGGKGDRMYVLPLRPGDVGALNH